jgi:hypothetical protein
MSGSTADTITATGAGQVPYDLGQGQPVLLGDVRAIWFDDDGGANEWGYTGRVVLRSGGTLFCTRSDAYNLVDLMESVGTPLPWREMEGSEQVVRVGFGSSVETTRYQKYFSLEVVEAATEQRFLALGQWHAFQWPPEQYAQVVAATFAGREPKAIEIPTLEGTVTCIPAALEGPIEVGEQGSGRVTIGGREFATEAGATTRRVQVLAKAGSAAKLIGRGSTAQPKISGASNLGGLAAR